MAELARAGTSIDIVTLSQRLAEKKEIQNVGGVAYLAGLTEGLPMRPAIGDYLRIIREKAIARRAIGLCTTAIERFADQSESAENLVAGLASDIRDLEISGSESTELESVGEWLGKNDVFEERKPGIMTGIEAYDDLTGGLQDGELTVIGARTSMGKTSHACTITWKIARRGKSVAVYLNEQAKHSFVGRMLCGRADVSFKAYKRGTLDFVERQYVQDAREEFLTLPIFWDSRPSMSVASIGSKAKRLKRTDELDVIVIDQLSGISNEGFWEKGKRTDEVIGDKVRALKVLGMELNVPIVLYHQLNRESLKNKDSRPTLSALQDSGKLEQIADNVDLLHRPGYYSHEKEEPDEVIRAKARDGETGTVKVEFIPWCCRWQDKGVKR